MSISAYAKEWLRAALGNNAAADEIVEVLDVAQVLSSAEAAYIDGVTPGTAAAGKAVVLRAATKDIDALGFTAQAVTPAADDGAGSTILPAVRSVEVGAVTNDADDWITLPSVADVPVGHQIVIACNAGSNFELRTPTTSGELINTVDSDGTQEYLCVDAEVVVVTKVSDADGWAAYDIPALGGVGTATVPD